MADPTLEAAHTRLLQALRSLGSPERAEQEKRYQKSRWEHWGVALPNMDVAIRETLGDLSQERSLDLCQRLWREPVWDLRIVAGRILARKSIAPDAKVWAFLTERLIDLDGWAVADNLAPVASRCLIEDPGRLDAVEAWIESPHLWTCRAALVFHPALGEGEARRRTDARLGRATGGGSRMVHPEGGGLVAARIVEARPRARAPFSDGPRREADGRRQA
jgi:hypothetical protein